MDANQSLHIPACNVAQRAWELRELFKTIEQHADLSNDDSVPSVTTIAILGAQICRDLAMYADGEQGHMLGMDVTCPPPANGIESIRGAYLRTVEAGEALLMDLDLTLIGDKASKAAQDLEQRIHEARKYHVGGEVA